jgi:NADPH:quinone reductase-like Zn-dependent oxidoreductase
MSKITTKAWLLYAGQESSVNQPSGLEHGEISFPDIGEKEVLAEPIYGCWEANMTHALQRRPTDVCRDRGEEKVVLGNAGVVRVLKTGTSIRSLREGDVCIVFCNGIWDTFGYPEKILAYDAPNTIGILARRTKLNEKQLIRIPADTRHSLKQWAAFSLRYITAWANWKRAYACWSLGFADGEAVVPQVWAWGGGVSLAELTLAKIFGCHCAMISSKDDRLNLIGSLGIEPIDRRHFPGLDYNEERVRSDPSGAREYRAAEQEFLSVVKKKCQGAGVSIFVDHIGQPVFRATLRALGRPGVVTTSGWKMGMITSTARALECMGWHTHVHTHYARYSEGLEAVPFAEKHNWMPPVEDHVYLWNDVPQLATEYASGDLTTYFPIFQINPI